VKNYEWTNYIISILFCKIYPNQNAAGTFDSKLHFLAGRFDSPLQNAVERFDSLLHDVAERLCSGVAGNQTSIQITPRLWNQIWK
jgi:hypothetical protein